MTTILGTISITCAGRSLDVRETHGGLMTLRCVLENACRDIPRTPTHHDFHAEAPVHPAWVLLEALETVLFPDPAKAREALKRTEVKTMHPTTASVLS